MNGALKQANKAIQDAVEAARKRRNEEDRKFLVASIGGDLLKQIKEAVIEGVVAAIKQIKVESPSVNVEQPKVEVTVPEIKLPEIKIPEIKVPEIKIPTIKVPTPKVNVTVKPTDVKMPKEMEVKGFKGFIKELKALVKSQSPAKESDEPKRMILVDPKTGNEYKAMGGILSSGGGGGGVVTVRKPTASKIDQLLLADPAVWYKLTMPVSMAGLSMFLGEQGALCYYRWDNEKDETQPRMPIFAGYSRHFENAKFGNRKLYLTSPTANQTIVVEYMLGEI